MTTSGQPAEAGEGQADGADPGSGDNGPTPPAASGEGRIGRRATLATLALVGSQVVSVVLSFAGVKIITNGVGLTEYGLYSIAFAFTSIFALLADFGVNAVTSREVAKRPADADSIIPLSIGLRLALSTTVAPLILLGSFAVYPTQPAILHLGIALIVLTFVSDAVRTVLYGYLTAKGRNYWIALATVLQQALFVALVSVAVASNAGLIGIFVSFLLASLVTTVAVAAVTRRWVQIRPRASLSAWRSLFKMAASIGTIQIINLLYLRVDGLMLSVLVGPAAVALYAIAYSVITGASVIPGFLMSSLLPSIVEETHRGRELLLGRAMNILTFLGSLLTALLLLAAPIIVTIISSSDFARAAAPLAILGLASVFTFANPAIGYSAAVLNVHHQLVWISLGGLLLNIILNVLLIPVAGVAGTATATVVCEVLGLVATFVSFRRRTELRVPVLPAAIRSACVIALALLAGAVLGPAVHNTVPVVAFLLIAGAVLCCGGVVLSAERTGLKIRHRLRRGMA